MNTAEAADELFVNRSKSFSSRSPPHVAHDIMSAGQRLVFLPYDREWKVRPARRLSFRSCNLFFKVARKSLHSSIGPTASKKLRPSQHLESCVLLNDILSHGDYSVAQNLKEGADGVVPEEHWFSLIRRYVSRFQLLLSLSLTVRA